MSLHLRALVDKLDHHARQSLESASAHCLGRGHQEVELEHWLLALVQEPDPGFALFCRAFDLDSNAWQQTLEAYLNRLSGGCQRNPVLSSSLIKALEKAWLFASLECRQAELQTPHVLGAILRDARLRQLMETSCHVLYHSVSIEQAESWIARGLWEDERQTVAPLLPSEPYPFAGNSSSESATPNLDRFTQDLTAQARAGGMDPVVGRDDEVRNMIDILIRRRQNNPILVGEAGVGKTAIVEGLAQKIIANDVPDPLLGSRVHALDLGLLQSGASARGEFEKRLKGVINEMTRLAEPVILFIDEAHTLIGAGGGSQDAANLLKPALARGELRTIAATTWREYKKYVETDPALTRRFQMVPVNEPDQAKAVSMMRALARTLRDHHQVAILDDALTAAVELSARYMPGRQLPDKAVTLLDTACARVSLSQSVTPARLADLEQQLKEMEERRQWLQQEHLSSDEHASTLMDLQQTYEQLRSQHTKLTGHWQQERALVNTLNELRQQLEASSQASGTKAVRERFDQVRQELNDLQGEQPLVYPTVNRQAIAAIVSQWTGIPLGQMVRDELHSLLNLQHQLERQVIGQPHAMASIAARIQSARANLTEPGKPVGVFLMIGPSGTGKTETALTLARELFGSERHLTVINMSEFKEEHKVSMLLGSPPGYVGYGEGGVLTESVRRKPYSVILLDEMEKAHPGLQDVFYNIFDKGSAKDGEGRDIDFRNTIIIMTSNACDEIIKAQVEQTPSMPTEVLLQACQLELSRHFKAAFLGRTSIIPYYPLANDTLETICIGRLMRLRERLLERFGVELSQDKTLPGALAMRAQHHNTGARLIDNMITHEILPDLARQCLSAQAEQQPVGRIHLALSEDGHITVKTCGDMQA